MPVQNFAGHRQDAVWKNGKHSPRESGIYPRTRVSLFGLWMAKIRQSLFRGAEFILKCDQPFVLHFRAAEIDALRARSLAFLDELPEEKRHAAKLVKRTVRASIFVNDVAAVPQREQRRNWGSIFSGHADMQ